MRPPTIRAFVSCLLVLATCGAPLASAQKSNETQLRGELKMRFNNCDCPEDQAKGPDITYLFVDTETKAITELELDEAQAKQFKADTPVTLLGTFKEQDPTEHHPSRGMAFKPTSIAFEEVPAKEQAAAEEEVANAAVTQDLRCLIIHADTNGQPANATKIQNMEDIVFNDTNNLDKAVQASTYGHYRVTHGVFKSITVDLTSTTASSTNVHTMEDLMVAALPAAFTALGETYSSSDYDRLLICVPNGTTDISTGYGYYGGNPRRTLYSYSWTGTTLDGVLHEFGHNFGFRHSGTGTNVYGDRTCVMGYSHLNRGNVTATYGAVKKKQNGWFAPFPNSETTLSGDATYDIYPIEQNPDTAPGMRCVKLSNSDHYISYRRQDDPYAWLRYDSDKDKVYIHRNSSFFSESWREAGLTSGSYTAGTTNVIFERYGPNKEYATVSFDYDDGNAKPVADAQTVNVEINSSVGITLTGSDSDLDGLSFELVTNPSNGVLTGSAPNLTYTPNNNHLGSDSFVFKVNDGNINSFATVTINVVEVNQLPVANNQSVDVFLNSPEPITLTASDANGDSLSFTVVANPSKGALSGTPPNLTYTPNNNVSDNDSFTFYASDSFGNSNTATVSITISASPNTPPSVEAGPNQTVSLQPVTDIPGLYYGTVPGNIETSIPNPESQLLVDPSTQTENSIAGNTTEIYTGNLYDADGQISFTEHIDDKVRLWIGGNLVLNNDAWNSRSSTANLNLTPGWHSFELRISNGGGSSGPVNGEIGIGYDPSGGTAWQVLTDPGDGSFLRVNATGSEAEATLGGTSVTDPEHSPTYVWTDTGTGTGTGSVTFSDANALSPTITFSDVGTYVLRLTADDGYTQTFDEVTITVELFNNNPPTTDAGEDQIVHLQESAASPGWSYTTWTNDADFAISSSHNYTVTHNFGDNHSGSVTVNGVEFTESFGTSGTGWSLTGNVRSTSDSSVNITGDGVNLSEEFIYDGNPRTLNFTGLTPAQSYQLDLYSVAWETGTRNQTFSATGTGISDVVINQSVYDNNNGIRISCIYTPSGTSQQFTITPTGGGTFHLYAMTNRTINALAATATLDGTVTDGEQTPSGSWSVVGGNASAVSFIDANAIDTDAIFTEAGTFTLRLTGSDGYEQSTDDVTITVNPALPTIYQTWAGGSFANSFDNIGTDDNPDGDSSSNLAEFAFGTDPTVNDGGSLATDGSANGQPMPEKGAGDAMELYFVRRDDHGSSGSITYTVQFSTDMVTFNNSATSPVFVADSSADSDYEVVKVPFPAGAKFGRVRVEAIP